MQTALRTSLPETELASRANFTPQARVVREQRPVQATGLPLSIRGLRKSFGDNEVLRGVDLHIPAGQFVAIVGKSGCGKSTLLRMIAGLEKIDAGSISFGDAVQAEDIRVMFQEPRLLPWARVLSNVEVGLGRDRASGDAHARAEKALSEVETRRQARPVAVSPVRWPEAARRARARTGVPSARAGLRRAARRARRADPHLDAAAAWSGSGATRALPRSW